MGLFKLGGRDLFKGLAVAVLTAVVAMLGNVVNLPNFDIFTYDWSTLITIAVTAGIGYLVKNLVTDEEGRVGGYL